MTHPETDVLVIGAGGPIGHALVRLLRSEDVAIATTTRSGVEYPLDVRDARQVRDLLSALRPSAVAYLVNPHLPSGARVRDVKAAAAAAARAAAAAAEVGAARFVFASSGAVYGDHREELLPESASLAGVGAYAALKIASERALSALSSSSMSVISARIFNVYGPGCDSSLVNRLAAGSVPAVFRTASFVRDYVHVDDVAAALYAAIRTPHHDVGAVNLGTGRAVSNLALMSMVPHDRFRSVDAPGLASFSVADPEYAASALDWRARRDMLDFLRT